MTISPAGIDMVKCCEALRLEAYKDAVGIWTIGYGTTRINGKPVAPGQTCTRKQAEDYLAADLATFQAAINSAVRVPLTQGQFDALCSFVYNIGIAAFRASTLLRLLNAKDYKGAAAQFQLWNKGGSPPRVLDGLIRRRDEEQALFEASLKG